MECTERITDTYQSSTPCRIAHVATCLERLELLATAATDKALRRESLTVLARLAWYVNNELGIAWPTQERLGQELGMSRQNVNRAIRQLEACGYLTRSHEAPRPDVDPCTVYRLLVPTPSEDVVTGESVVTGDYMGESPVTTGGESPVTTKHSSVNPVLNPVPRKSPTDSSGGGTAARRERPPARPPEPQFGYLPARWKPSEQALTAAMSKYQLTREQVLDQTERFMVNHRSKLTRSGDWLALWGLWVSDARPGGPQRWRIEGGRTSYANHLANITNLDRSRDEPVPINGGWS